MKKIIVIGSLNCDYVVNIDHIPMVGETILADDINQYFGGKGANQASAIARLGGNVTMLGAVGADEIGSYMLDNLSQAGVCIDHIKKVQDERTGQAWIGVNRQGNNSIIVIPGANSAVDIAYLESKKDLIAAADIIVMQLETPLQAIIYAAKTAKQMGKYVILDPAPAICDMPGELLANVDLIKPNESELQILTGCTPDKCEQGARTLQQRGVENVVVSMGEQGVLCLKGQSAPLQIPAHKVDVVDTTAAGDSFLAAIALCLAKGFELEQAIEYAQLVASIVVTRAGAQTSIPTAAELEIILQEKGILWN